MPKVSVVIPAYNAMTYLPETVESVWRQTFNDFEVLIIDDGSSDQIGEWASLITDPRLKLISQENQGLSGARNTGIAKAQGEYIAFLDADDVWEPTKLEKQVRCLEDNPAVGLAYSWTAYIDEKGKSTGRVMTADAEGDVWRQIIERNIIDCPSVVVRRCCFETVGVFDRNLRSIEDWDMWIRIASRYPFAVIKEPLVNYRHHASNMSKNWQVMEKSFRLVIEKAFHSAPPELLFLKNRSYGHANVRLAWKALQCSDRDYKKAIQFLQQALVHYPQLRYSSEYVRLRLALAAFQWLGHDGYSRVVKLAYALRRRMLSIAR